jgi:hypothetical protein
MREFRLGIKNQSWCKLAKFAMESNLVREKEYERN